MIINHNISALNSQRQFGLNVKKMDSNIESLSSGLRINKGADDAAGLAVSEKMRAQVRGLNQASRNIQDGISLIQTTEGFLKETSDAMQRMRELSVQASNGTYNNEDRAQITVEMDEMIKEINRVHEDAKFNTLRLLDGKTTGLNSFGPRDGQFQEIGTDGPNWTSLAPGEIGPARNVNFNVDGSTGMNGVVVQSGANTDERMFLKLDQFNSFTLGLTGLPTVDPQTAPVRADAMRYSGVEGANSINDNLAWREFSFYTPTELNLESALYLESGITPSASSQDGVNEVRIDILNPIQDGGNGIGNRVDLRTSESATETIAVLDVALNKVNKRRADLGAFQNRLEMAQEGVDSASENLQSAESRIRDADMAKEFVEFTKNQILSQSASTMTAQANMRSQLIMRIIG